MFERQRSYATSGFMIAANAGKGDQRADIGAPARQLRRFLRGIEILAL
jgi:hypothetical protein